MTVSTSRKLSAGALTVVLVGGTLAVFGPVMVSSWRVRRFCEALPAGTAASEVQSKINARGYSMTKLVDGTYAVESSVTLGRIQCQLAFDSSNRLVAQASAK